jgi:hypothetical protein
MNTTTSNPYIGRWVTIGTIVIGVVAAALPVVGNMDFSSTSGIIAGLVAVSAVIVKYLDGWQKHEERQALGVVSAATAPPADGGEPSTEPTVSTETGEDDGDDGEIAPVTQLPVPPLSTPPVAALQPVDDEEPEPGDEDDPMPLAPGDEVSDVPDPPTDDEIAAVAQELAEGDAPARRAA